MTGLSVTVRGKLFAKVGSWVGFEFETEWRRQRIKGLIDKGSAGDVDVLSTDEIKLFNDLKRKIMGWQELWQASVVKDSILMRKYFGDASLVSGGDENDGAGVAQSGGSSQASDDMAGSPPGNLHGLSDFVDNMLHDFTESDNDSSDNTSYGSMFLF